MDEIKEPIVESKTIDEAVDALVEPKPKTRAKKGVDICVGDTVRLLTNVTLDGRRLSMNDVFCASRVPVVEVKGKSVRVGRPINDWFKASDVAPIESV